MPDHMKLRTLSAFAAATLALSLSACATRDLNTDAADLKTALAGEPVDVTLQSGSLKLTSTADYLYPSGGWELRPGVPLLSKMVPTLSKLQRTNIMVAGYTDNTPIGPQLKSMGVTDNVQLSLNRAKAVVTFLQSQGVKPSLLSAQGFGDANPIASNATAEGRAKNRRVEITLTGDGS
jgi:chemotaxis protein MotB